MSKTIQTFRTVIIVLIVLCPLTLSAVQEKLVFAVTLIRHGDRTPVYAIQTSPHKWEIGLGELTPHGMNQEFKLGTELRKRYVEQFKLLSSHYINNSIYVRSTDFNRTIISAQSLLAGLYPLGFGPIYNSITPALPAAQQPIPIRTLPKDQDNLLLAKDNYIKQFRAMGEQYVFTSQTWKEANKKYEENFNRWSNIFGENIKNLRDLIPIGDNLNVRMLNNIPLPKGISQTEAEEVIKISNWAMAQEFKPRNISYFLAKEFLEKLIIDLEKAMTNKQPYKYILYSAHDSTILPVMSAIGLPLEYTPPYASNISFELFNTNNEFFVNIRFNGKDLYFADSKNKTSTFEEFKKEALPGNVKTLSPQKNKISNPNSSHEKVNNSKIEKEKYTPDEMGKIYHIDPTRNNSELYELNEPKEKKTQIYQNTF